MKKAVKLFVGLGLFCFSLTITYLSMRAVMGVGGYCAEGGPYVIATHCPGGTAWMDPLALILMCLGVFIYLSADSAKSPRWGIFFWAALFCSLGWNFLDFAINHSDVFDPISGWVCGILFMIMGAGPLLLLIDRGEWGQLLFGSDGSRPGQTQVRVKGQKNLKIMQDGLKNFPRTSKKDPSGANESQAVLLFLHLLALAGGIYLGAWVFNIF